MKDKIWKWMKYKWAVVCFVIAVILIAVSGSLAAYTSFNSVKRVVSTGKRSDTMFGSNYLTLVDLGDNENQYTTKRISPTEVIDHEGNITGYTFTVQVCNYVYGNETTYNPKNITYTLTVGVKALDGGDLPANINDIEVNDQSFSSNPLSLNGSLSGERANADPYIFVIPKDLKNRIKIQIVATPNDASKNAVNNQKLAGVITFSDLELTKNWKGHFIDDSEKHIPDQYDAFNYEIYGNGAGTVTLTWPVSLQISKWFIEDRRKDNSYISNESNSLKFYVKEDVTAYQLQFYRNPNASLDLTAEDASAKWAELEGMVTCTFDPQSGTASTSS